MVNSKTEQSRLALAEASLAGLLPPSDWRPAIPANITARTLGERLWQQALVRPRADDRPLYWKRLALLRQLASKADDPVSLPELELASRGMLDVSFSADAAYRVLVTGFDPFHLDTHIEQGNPSGVVALAQHGRTIDLSAGKAEIRAMIFPVRFSDFDEFLVERVLETILESLDMVITVSMGRNQFDLERFPGRRRSVSTLDNSRREGGGSPGAPLVPPFLEGPEFVEFSLPVASMLQCRGEYVVNDNRLVTTLESGELQAGNLSSLASKTAVKGSGGGYLSNEISYRVLRLISEKGLSIPAGHIHTPGMQGFDQPMVNDILGQCSDLIEAAILALP